jgi:putative membrane protein
MSFYQKTPVSLLAVCLFSAILAGLIANWLIHSIDSKSIISARRFFVLLSVSTLIWIVPVLIGIPFSSLLNGATTREFVFGAFLAWGFELVVINAAFLRSTLQSLLISAIHPVPILLLILSTIVQPYLVPAIAGLTILLIMMAFLWRINHIKTKNGISSLEILRAFLKTWVGHEPEEIETYFSKYARRDSVTTDVITAHFGDREAIIVLPGIHPGPFSPVGSYNISELIYNELSGPSTIPIVLHGTGGHERNLPTNKLASEYAAEISRFVRTKNDAGKQLMRGPLRSKVGITNITTIAFGNEVLAIVSNSPYRSDDLDPASVADAFGAADELGLRVIVIDAHNSVDGEDGPQEKITRSKWTTMLTNTLQLNQSEFRIGVANSNETDFKRGADISDGGISVTVFATQEAKSVLVSADSNNATSGLRERIEIEVTNMGMSFLDLCTSDTHKLAARNLTNRGYFALGEQSDPNTIIDCIKKLIRMAEDRLARCDLQIARFKSDVPLVGEEALDEFATLTKNSISMVKRYGKGMLPVFLLLLTITLFY